MPCVLVNPRIPVATADVFKALGLRNGQLLVGATDVFRGTAWPEAGASLEDWVEALAAEHNDLEAPATRIQPVIGKVIAALNATNGAWLARMSGSGATCFAIYENTADAAARGAENPARSPRLVGACGGAELARELRRSRRRTRASENPSPAMKIPEPCRRRCKTTGRPASVARALEAIATTTISATVLSATVIRPSAMN